MTSAIPPPKELICEYNAQVSVTNLLSTLIRIVGQHYIHCMMVELGETDEEKVVTGDDFSLLQ